MYKVKQASTETDFKNILQLRFDVLRKPWNQPIETATDDLEQSSINAFIEDENGNAIACGRLQENENHIGQIRFMAVSSSHQGKGLGKMIIKFLEAKAKEKQLKEIQLQARENAVKFYKSCGYSIKETSFLLWGQIQHYLMSKTTS
ncbi:MAG: GNAT family N-acetyltransferase [Bacteroidota bacterium]|nr:GNAT family N-acetyltransferase [Bacteroidota bacterium]